MPKHIIKKLLYVFEKIYFNYMFQTFFGLRQTAELEIVLDRPDGKKKLDESSKKDQSLIYYDGETVSGKVI